MKRAIAANPNTPAAVLGSLADDNDEQIRQAVTFNGATPWTLLAELVGRSIDLAILVAMNPAAPVPSLPLLRETTIHLFGLSPTAVDKLALLRG
ncbi:hypothetical protein [Paeniglutamicibacter psychrophenolicus]|uniref:hypothetical protein n=1 Tax=Paeniglutamicibacter psychrophenolicus TaxID=257454 RepID=UPI00278847A0|nr:hypothetical protein [Paeniglutamicibacter psychrophenolicus]MDQ0093068.1 hypothetical protein [Paeniglutamicibacter psychrophenolicus]